MIRRSMGRLPPRPDPHQRTGRAKDDGEHPARQSPANKVKSGGLWDTKTFKDEEHKGKYEEDYGENGHGTSISLNCDSQLIPNTLVTVVGAMWRVAQQLDHPIRRARRVQCGRLPHHDLAMREGKVGGV